MRRSQGEPSDYNTGVTPIETGSEGRSGTKPQTAVRSCENLAHIHGESLSQICPSEGFSTGQGLATSSPSLCSAAGEEQCRGSMAWCRHCSGFKDVVSDYCHPSIFPAVVSLEGILGRLTLVN